MIKFKDPRKLTSEQEEQFIQFVKKSRIKVGDIVALHKNKVMHTTETNKVKGDYVYGQVVCLDLDEECSVLVEINFSQWEIPEAKIYGISRNDIGLYFNEEACDKIISTVGDSIKGNLFWFHHDSWDFVELILVAPFIFTNLEDTVNYINYELWN